MEELASHKANHLYMQTFCLGLCSNINDMQINSITEGDLKQIYTLSLEIPPITICDLKCSYLATTINLKNGFLIH